MLLIAPMLLLLLNIQILIYKTSLVITSLLLHMEILNSLSLHMILETLMLRFNLTRNLNPYRSSRLSFIPNRNIHLSMSLNLCDIEFPVSNMIIKSNVFFPNLYQTFSYATFNLELERMFIPMRFCSSILACFSLFLSMSYFNNNIRIHCTEYFGIMGEICTLYGHLKSSL